MMNKAYLNIMHTWMFGNIQIADICRKIKAAGFDGIDLSISDDESYSIKNYKISGIQKIASDCGLIVPVASALMKGPTHDLSQSDDGLRWQAIDFVRCCIDAASYAGAKDLLVMPSRIFNTTCHTSRSEDWKRSAESLAICAEYAKRQGVSLMLEPLNRQRVTMVRNMEEGLKMICDVGEDNVYLVPDIYQMSMEEPKGLVNSIRKYGKWIRNIHVADSTRHVPGTGNYNWNEILTALWEVGYRGPLSHEPVFIDFDAARVSSDVGYEKKFIRELKIGVSFMHAQMDAIKFVSNTHYGA